MRARRLFSIVVMLLVVSASAFAQTPQTEQRTQTSAELATALFDATTAWLSSLTGEQKTKALMHYVDNQRTDWHFIPRVSRKGLPLSEMTPKQRDLAHRLIQVSLSRPGYEKLSAVMKQQEYLHVKLNQTPQCCGKYGTACAQGDGCQAIYNSGFYYISVFSQPSATALWGLSIEGHHFSVNYSIDKGRIVSSTPDSIGSNPETMMSDDYPPIPKGTRILPQEENIAFELLASLDDTQRRLAVSSEPAHDIWNAGGVHPYARPPLGLAASLMTPPQRAILQRLVTLYANLLPQAVAVERLAAIEAEGFDNVHFSFQGSPKPGENRQYRVQGPGFLIEFLNAQPDPLGNPANHIHTVWRDLRNDFNQPNPFYDLTK